MGNPDSIVEESYTGEGALLEHRQYTKPAVWRGIAVPDVLLSGDHGKVDRFAATKRWPAPPRFGRTLSRHWIARRWIRPIARP